MQKYQFGTFPNEKNQFGTFPNKKKNNIGHSQIKNIAFFLSYRIFLSHFYLTSNA